MNGDAFELDEEFGADDFFDTNQGDADDASWKVRKAAIKVSQEIFTTKIRGNVLCFL